MLKVRHPVEARRARGFAGKLSDKAVGLVVRAATMTVGMLLLWASLSGHAAQAPAGTEDGGHRHHMAPDTLRTLADYAIPRVALVREDGRNVVLTNEIDDGKPVVLTFVYTTCTTICPLTSMTLAELQARLGDARDRVHLVSISIDPEQDTPARLRDYAHKFGAGPEWHHYTGTVGASVASQRAFDVYRGDKMSHAPVTLLRTGPNARWVRIEGFATADQLLAELRPAVGAQ